MGGRWRNSHARKALWRTMSEIGAPLPTTSDLVSRAMSGVVDDERRRRRHLAVAATHSWWRCFGRHWAIAVGICAKLGVGYVRISDRRALHLLWLAGNWFMSDLRLLFHLACMFSAPIFRDDTCHSPLIAGVDRAPMSAHILPVVQSADQKLRRRSVRQRRGLAIGGDDWRQDCCYVWYSGPIYWGRLDQRDHSDIYLAYSWASLALTVLRLLLLHKLEIFLKAG